MRQLGGEPGYAQEVAGELAAGNLAVKIELEKGDSSSLMHAMERMRANLASVVGQVRMTSENIAAGSADIAAANSDFSQRTEAQASNLQQTAASMEQISTAIQSSVETVTQANDLASSASAAAVGGGAMVGMVTQTMQKIAGSSKRISDVITVIDSIAFQPNILALNPAVEAARAGEQGRGFAVVASEVRSLAGQSAGAAKEIKTLIGESVSRIKVDAQQALAAGASMEEIVSQVKGVSVMLNEISSATREQSAGIVQVESAVSQLYEVTQQNVALAELGAGASDTRKGLAASLDEAVGAFRVAIA